MNKILLATLSVCFLLVLSSFNVNQDTPDAIVGSWKNGEGTGIINIYTGGAEPRKEDLFLRALKPPDFQNPRK